MTAEEFDFLLTSLRLLHSHWLSRVVHSFQIFSMIDIWEALGTHLRVSHSLNSSHVPLVVLASYIRLQRSLASAEPPPICLWSLALVSELIKPVGDLKIRAKVVQCEPDTSQFSLNIPRFRGHGPNGFGVTGSSLWKSLPANIHANPSLPNFNKQVREFLFGQMVGSEDRLCAPR